MSERGPATKPFWSRWWNLLQKNRGERCISECHAFNDDGGKIWIFYNVDLILSEVVVRYMIIVFCLAR